MSDSNMRNMTEGSVPRHLLLFALPMFAGSVLQQLYNMVDSWVVGNYVGDGALAAVGACYPVSFLIISLFMGVSTGGTVRRSWANIPRSTHRNSPVSPRSIHSVFVIFPASIPVELPRFFCYTICICRNPVFSAGFHSPFERVFC